MEARPQSVTYEVARRIAEARLKGLPVAPAKGTGFPRSESDGYAVQAQVHRLLSQAGRGDLVGYKVGMSVRAFQTQYGLSGPATGGLLANSVFLSGSTLRRPLFLAPGVECEIALTLARDLAQFDPTAPRSLLLESIAACHAAIEIVDNRYADVVAMDGATLIADDVLNAASIIGPACSLPDALTSLRGTLAIDGTPKASGSPGETCGDPISVLAWLAGHAASLGEPLRAGQIVLCGSVTPIIWLDTDRSRSTATITASFDGMRPAYFHLAPA